MALVLAEQVSIAVAAVSSATAAVTHALDGYPCAVV